MSPCLQQAVSPAGAASPAAAADSDWDLITGDGGAGNTSTYQAVEVAPDRTTYVAGWFKGEYHELTSGAGFTSFVQRIDPDGSVMAATGVTEQGQGTEAIIRQVVAEAVGVPIEQVRVITGDTLTTPYGGGTWACRGAGIGGESALQSGIAVKEAALKVAEQAQGPAKSKILHAANSFHGKTKGVLSVTDSTLYQSQFKLVENRVKVPFGNIEAVRLALESDPAIGIVVMETIQGGGGIVEAPEGFWRELRALCDKYGVLWIADEVQCGLGRTGSGWFRARAHPGGSLGLAQQFLNFVLRDLVRIGHGSPFPGRRLPTAR